jgi:hypothetical protein
MRKVDASWRINDAFVFSQREGAGLFWSFLLFSFSYYSKKNRDRLTFRPDWRKST